MLMTSSRIGPVDGTVVPLPTAEQIRAAVQRMVDFGPRLTGYPGHDEFCAWVEREMRAAGLQIAAYDVYGYDCYRTGDFSLEVLDGSASRPVDVSTFYVRSVGTPPEGVTGPLVLAEGFPDTDALAALVDPNAASAAVRKWVASVADGTYRDSILLVELSAPGALTAGVFTAVSTYLQWDGHTVEDWAQIDYSRAWMGPWLDLAELVPLGVKGVVLATRASKEMLRGNNSPHIARPQPIPALVVDRETGSALRAQAERRPQTRLRLEVAVEQVKLRQLTAILPGASDECIIVNTHTDGQNAFEENGAVATVAMARHFASLPDPERLHRTLVFALYPGHMSGRVGIEDPRGWILKHPQLVENAVGAVSIEHLGATEWVDDDHGFRPTGEIEIYGIWTTQGAMCEQVALPALVESGLQRHALLKPPVQVTPGRAFHWLGVPHVSGIAGPTYLLKVTDNGEMDKFDAELASRQIGFYADVVRRLDRADRTALHRGDPTLGQDGGAEEDREYRDPSATVART
jgi:hypothetical protein